MGELIKMKKILIVILLLIPLVLSQGPQVKLNHFGYGKTPQEVKFTIHCLGEIPISNMTVYVDGEEHKNIYAYLTPKTGIELSLHLEPGEHLIEVKTPEGAYDSEVVTVSSVPHKEVQPKEVISFTKSNNFKVIVAFVVISVIVVWLLMKRPKLEL